jgi:hypothetical protein
MRVKLSAGGHFVPVIEAYTASPDIRVKRYPAKVARGARKAQTSARGDGPSMSHAAQTTGRVLATSRDNIRAYAARGLRS